MRMNPLCDINTDLVSLDENLLLLLDMADNFLVDLQSLSSDVRRSQGQPLSERDVCDTVTLIDLNPHEFLGVGRVLNVVS